MKKFAYIALGLALLLAFAPEALAQLCTDPVETESGLVRGQAATESAACSWLGIPYAAPPVGDLRWAAPRPAPPWEGVFEASEIGASCMQKGFMKLLETADEMSEDCLYLNVWRPARSGSFPVMIWLHGGAYMGGSGTYGMYRGDRLAEFGDVVVVTINYRLGPFAFLAHPLLREEDPNKSTGSYGSLDQVRAIQWVHDNIEGFGGDPENVTVFGESAGGWSVCTMLATPLTSGKIHRAIIESGGCATSHDLEQGYEQAAEVAQALGCDFEDIACLRNVSAKKILDKTGGQLAGCVWQPHHDGYLLTDKPLNMIKAGNYNHIPLMAGSNQKEMDNALYLFGFVRRMNEEEGFPRMIEKLIGPKGEEAHELAALYPFSDYEGKSAGAMGHLASDGIIICPTYNGMAAAAANQDQVYYYRFDYHGFLFGSLIEAFHAMEVTYVFNSMDRMPVRLLYYKKHLPAAREISKIIQGYWVNFAHTGNPNGPGLPEWPQFRPDSMNVQVLDSVTRTERADLAERCAFWEEWNQSNPTVYETLLRPNRDK